jgi:L-alanine-DL-glutamate epimerase-like enolase superfamily enzyme
MKITKVEVFLVNPREKGNHAVLHGFSPIAVRIDTDEGISGWGEGIAYGTEVHGMFGVTQDLAATIIGKDPFASERIWEDLRNGWVMTGGPVTYCAVSAIDIALWDIKGKALGVPIYQLLGGKSRDRIPTYLSHTEFGWPWLNEPLGTAEAWYESTLEAAKLGYTAVKANFFRFDKNGKWEDPRKYRGFRIDDDHLNLVADRISAVQKALGPRGGVILDNNALTTAEGAIATIEASEGNRILFFEEPVIPNSPETMKYVADRIGNVPIATGEQLTARWGFYPYLENRSVRIAQPDLGNTGGLSEAKKIADLALLFDVQISTHVCGGPLIEAAALHLAAAIPNFYLHEHHATTFIPVNRKLGKLVYESKDGFLDIPEVPGLGQELSDFAIEHSFRIVVD